MKISKIMDKMKNYLENISNGEYLDDIMYKFESVQKLFNQIPKQTLFPKSTLFPKLTEAKIRKVKGIDSEEQAKIHKVINDLRKVVHNWDDKAFLVPFGSLVNGFWLKNSSDIDLTLIIKDKKGIHPSNYCQGLLEQLNEDSDYWWDVIDTENIFLFCWDYYEGFKVDICFNNITGLINSEYIRTLAQIDSRFHEVGKYI